MNKEEILAKSRAENKNKDYYELEVLAQAGQAAMVVMVCLAGAFLVLQLSLGGGINHGMYALVTAASMTMYWVKWAKLRRHHELVMAVLWTIPALVFSSIYVYSLMAI